MRKLVDFIIITSILALTSFFMLDLAIPGMPKFHDSNPHVARMIAYGQALDDGQYPPMWAKEVLGGIGSPVMMLNYQLPYMISESFVRMGLTIFESYKLSLALSFTLSALLMYLALKTKFGRLGSYLGAMVYVLAPYRIVDIYVRGALGESLSFLFPPLLIWGFTKKSWPLLIIGWAGLFLTHPVASATFSAFFLGYVIITMKKETFVEKMSVFWIPYFIALMISAFNLLPTLALTKYTYYSPTLSDTLLMFPSLNQLIYSPWGYGVSLPGPGDGMSFALGNIQWIVLIAGLVFAVVSKKLELKYLIFCSLTALYFILPMSSPIYKLFNLTEIIDFPWRLLLCLIFALSWIAALVSDQIKHKFVKKIIVITAVLILGLQTSNLAHTNEYWNKDLTWFSRETGDSYGEYAPLTRATRDSAPFGKRAEFVEGNGEVTTLVERSNYQRYKVSSAGDGYIRINTAYFPGWQIPSNCEITKRTLSHIDDSGLIGCRVTKGESELSIRYVAPPVQKVGNLISLVGIGGYLWILFQSFYPRSTKKMRS